MLPLSSAASGGGAGGGGLGQRSLIGARAHQHARALAHHSARGELGSEHDRLVAQRGDRHHAAAGQVLEGLLDQVVGLQPEEVGDGGAADARPGVELGAVPVFSDLVSLQYVRPDVRGEILFGNSDLAELEIADPDGYLNRADEAFLDLTVDKVSTRFPAFTDASITSSYAGCYDVTPDWNPVISRGPLDGLVIAAGFSGHGFKISPAVGRLVADLVVEVRSELPDDVAVAGTDAASAVRNILKTRAQGLEVGPILMGMGNKAHIVTPSITARGLLNISALAGTPVTHYG